MKEMRQEPWEHGKELRKKRDEARRPLMRLKGFRRIFTRFDKLDGMFIGVVVLALRNGEQESGEKCTQ